MASATNATVSVALKRPGGVTFLAFLLFARAAFLLMAAAFLYADPKPTLLMRRAVYIAAHGTDPPLIFLPLVAISLVVVGWGLLRLKQWARRTLLAASGLMLLRWLRYFLLTGLDLVHPSPLTQSAQTTAGILLALDTGIFLYLLQFTVRRAFERPQERSAGWR